MNPGKKRRFNISLFILGDILGLLVSFSFFYFANLFPNPKELLFNPIMLCQYINLLVSIVLFKKKKRR
ncbi:hypothetical protein Y136_14400 [Listeria monocytogenes]|nr:hypothetical protein [Listeria monocytogenes]